MLTAAELRRELVGKEPRFLRELGACLQEEASRRERLLTEEEAEELIGRQQCEDSAWAVRRATRDLIRSGWDRRQIAPAMLAVALRYGEDWKWCPPRYRRRAAELAVAAGIEQGEGLEDQP